MGRERLMKQQRERMLARRKRLKETKAEIKKYGSGNRKGVTRDTSNDGSKRNIARDKLLQTPPPPLPPIPGAKPKTKPKAKPAEVKPSTPPKPKSTPKPTPKKVKGKKPSTDSNIMSSSSTYTGNNLRKPLTKKVMPYAGEFPGTPKTEKPKPTSRRNRRDKIVKPKKGDKKTITVGSKRVVMMWDGKRWVPAK